MSHARSIGRLSCLGLACAATGCAGVSPEQARSHAELSREANLVYDEAVFVMGDTLGAHMIRAADAERDGAPVFIRRTPDGFQAADALGAATLSSRPALAGVPDEQ